MVKSKNLHKTNKYFSFIKNVIGNIIFSCVIIALIVITIRISYQTIAFPDKIPDMFGIKMFFIFENQDSTPVKYGDLVFTKNIKTDTLKIGDVIAFRDESNIITLRKISNIENGLDAKENKNIQVFTIETLETGIVKAVRENKVEGLLIGRIAKLGSVIYFIQQPIAMIGISCGILLVGAIFYYIAYKLDEKDMKELEKNCKSKT